MLVLAMATMTATMAIHSPNVWARSLDGGAFTGKQEHVMDVALSMSEAPREKSNKPSNGANKQSGKKAGALRDACVPQEMEQDAITRYLAEYLEKANNGDAEAQYLVGRVYLEGRGDIVKQDKTAGCEYLAKSYMQGYYRALRDFRASCPAIAPEYEKIKEQERLIAKSNNMSEVLTWVISIFVILTGVFAVYRLYEDKKIEKFLHENNMIKDEKFYKMNGFIVGRNNSSTRYCVICRDISNSYVFDITDIEYCAIDIDGKTEAAGQFGTLVSAAIGGMAFGGFGAVVGAIAGKEVKTERKVNVYLSVKNQGLITMKMDKISDVNYDQVLLFYHTFFIHAESNKATAVSASAYTENNKLNAVAAGEKPCPFCAETIKTAALVCKHCGRDLPRTLS
jgi:hypothetical protein